MWRVEGPFEGKEGVEDESVSLGPDVILDRAQGPVGPPGLPRPEGHLWAADRCRRHMKHIARYFLLVPSQMWDEHL